MHDPSDRLPRSGPDDVRSRGLRAGRVRPAPAVEFLVGYAGFVDDATIDHTIFGGAGRVYLTPRVAVGPELVYMRGPNCDRDLFLTGNLTFDVLPPRLGRPARVTPFLVAGGGFFQHSDRFGSFDVHVIRGSVHGRRGSARLDHRSRLRAR